MLDVINHLTERDRDLITVLGDHQVLTTHQITRAYFTSPERARSRLAVLHRLDVLARFRHPRGHGSDPYHYLLGYTGACLHAAARSEPWPKPASVAERTARIAASPKLTHTLGVNDFFTRLIADTRWQHWRLQWRNETQAADHTGGMIRPDAHASVTTPAGAGIDFYYEHDTGTEDHTRLTAKLERYRHVAEALPVLIELPTATRETNLHRRLAGHTYPFTIATTRTDLTCAPTEAIWTPLHGIEMVELLQLNAR